MTIANDPLRVIVLMASAFFWLLALLFSSVLWFIVVPLQEQLWFGVMFSVIFQEVFRLVFYIILRYADAGLKKVSEREDEGSSLTLVTNKALMAYVCGFGFGLMSGAFSFFNVLADIWGPGTIGINGDNNLFFVTSALLTLCFILLHTTWGIIFFNGLDNMNNAKIHVLKPILVCIFHLLTSGLTFLNQPNYLASIIPAYVVLALTVILSLYITGFTSRGLKMTLSNGTARRR